MAISRGGGNRENRGFGLVESATMFEKAGRCGLPVGKGDGWPGDAFGAENHATASEYASFVLRLTNGQTA